MATSSAKGFEGASLLYEDDNEQTTEQSEDDIGSINHVNFKDDLREGVCQTGVAEQHTSKQDNESVVFSKESEEDSGGVNCIEEIDNKQTKDERSHYTVSSAFEVHQTVDNGTGAGCFDVAASMALD